MILTHYYHPNDEPFQTLSSLSEADALNIIASLQQRTGSVYRRFENPLKYLSQTENRVFYNPGYHGNVFRLSEIFQIIEQFGIPDTEWQTEPNRKYDLFIEAQVWDNIKYPQP